MDGKHSKTKAKKRSSNSNSASLGIIKKGRAMRVIFFYPGEEGTYVDHAEVTLYENGIIHIQSAQEETTTHLQNCEILWQYELEGEDRKNKVKLVQLRPKASQSVHASPDQSPEL